MERHFIFTNRLGHNRASRVGKPTARNLSRTRCFWTAYAVRLVLLVHTFASAEKDAADSTDLHVSVTNLRATVASERPDLERLLEEKLEEAGYDDEHEYEVTVCHRATESFSVDDGFPRIVPGDYPVGPVEISYDLLLAHIDPFKIAKDELVRLMSILE